MTSWWLTKFVPSIHTVVFLVALPLNLMAIVMFLVKMKVRKAAVVYMLNLATADVLFVCILPFRIVYRFMGNNWLIGEGMCRFVMSSFYCNKYCSILFMTSISVDRFLAVVYPIRSISWRRVNRAWLVCGIIWVISLASTIPLLIPRLTFSITALNITTCFDVQDSKVFEGFSFYYFISYRIVFFIIPLFVITLCYIGTICSLCGGNVARTHWRSRAVYLTAVVLFVFVLSFGPTNVIFLTYYLQMYKYGDATLNFAYMLSASMSSIRCCLNPIIYFYASFQYQTYMSSLLCGKKTVRNRRTRGKPVLS
ncbi:PREDICTED: proteinase-activated receptor 1-like [Nanorana parkeri]|uniref:proteinase-activated receptor 1-like n=1 Tax=Nanorana parkeri TaxID=125878 RepID=UPI00085413F1|nr:PREDICTED: proteinase-activated receptor 1-like [Nanorana parkeri]